MKIVVIGNPILRKKAKPIRKVTRELVRLADSMEELMKPTGVGLAAPQIGISEAFFYLRRWRGTSSRRQPADPRT